MSEIVIPNQTSAVEPAPSFIPTDTVRSLAEWASEMEAAYAIASKVCNTMFAPQHFRGKPEEAAAAILYGDTLGIPPMVALKTIYAVHGTPALYAQQMFALALSKGHHIERVFADETRVEFRCRRRGAPNWQKVEWTIERARKAKYTSNPKYAENPIGMLTEKCKAEAAKLVAPEALAGMNSVEEIELGDFTPLEDLGEVPAAPTPQENPKPRTASGRIRQAKAKVNPEQGPVDLEDAPEAEPATDSGRDWEVEASNAGGDEQTLRELYNEAQAAGAPSETLNFIRAQVAA